MKKLILILTAINGYLHSDPWGKDSDLLFFQIPHCQKKENYCQTPFFGDFGEAAIALRQKIMSPADGPRSHFRPTSSQYTLDAIRKYGFFYGYLLGCDRLMRENDDPWLYQNISIGKNKQSKWDPVR